MVEPTIRRLSGLNHTCLLLWLLFPAAVLFAGCAQSSQERPHPEAAKQLLKLRGYEFDEKAFFAAADAGDLWAVESFLAAGMNPNAAVQSGETVLMQAAKRGNIELVRALLRGGADINAKDSKGYTALAWAADNRDTSVASILLADPRIDVNVRSATGAGILAIYVARGREDVLPMLLKKGADADTQDKDGDTPLHGAALNGNSDILRLLLENGADPNIRNNVGGTALMWAAAYGHPNASQLLLDKGADPAVKDVDGLTAADWAERNEHVDLARMLREAKKPKT